MTLRIGTNLSAVGYFTDNQPFLKIFKTAPSWSGNIPGQPRQIQSDGTMQLDSNGYPTTMAATGLQAGNTFSEIDVIFLRGLISPYYHSGRYVFYYVGTWTFVYNNDITKVSEGGRSGGAGTGRVLLDAVPSTNGMQVQLTSTGAGAAYAKDFILVYAPTATTSVIDPNETAALAAAAGDLSQAFNPDFVNRTRSYNALRFMEWISVISSEVVNWADTTQPSYVTWASDNSLSVNCGVPIAVQIALCNLIGADAWFNIPYRATDDYIKQFASLAHSTLSSGLKVTLEFGNEWWQIFGDSFNFTYCFTQGLLAFPSSPNNNNSGYVFCIMRQVQCGKIWKAVWGADASRITNVMGTQCANTGFTSFALGTLPTDWGGLTASFTGTISGAALTVSGVTGTVAIYQQITGPGVADGTYIESGSGTSWTVNNSQSVGPVSMTAAYWTGASGSSTNVDALSTAPYWFYTTPASWTADSDLGVSKLQTEINSGGLMNPSGLTPTTTGTTTAYALVTGQSLPSTPANQTMVVFNVGAGQANGAGVTLACDGGTAFPLQDNTGTAINAGDLPVGGPYVASFTNATSAGSVTAAWRLTFDTYYPLGMMNLILKLPGANSLTAQKAMANSNGLRFVCYEGGQQFVVFRRPNNPLVDSYNALNLDASMQATYTSFLNQVQTIGAELFMNYSDIGPIADYAFPDSQWGALQTVLLTSAPKFDALINFINGGGGTHGGASWIGRLGEFEIGIREAMLLGAAAILKKNPVITRRIMTGRQ
jgi:hypothetical protein